jgi:hypothetical protein
MSHHIIGLSAASTLTARASAGAGGASRAGDTIAMSSSSGCARSTLSTSGAATCRH